MPSLEHALRTVTQHVAHTSEIHASFRIQQCLTQQNKILIVYNYTTNTNATLRALLYACRVHSRIACMQTTMAIDVQQAGIDNI
jgi:hypothetical protein